MARPNWEYIRIDVLLMEHPKIEGLSDRAFRCLMDLWCYCGRNRTDGLVTEKRWKAVGKRVQGELIKAGLAEPRGPGEGCAMHDFAGGPEGHQRTRAEIDELAAKRSDSGRKAAQARWG